MNKLKTLFYFLGYFIIGSMGVQLIEIVHFISDYLYIILYGISLGFIPLYIASSKALEITNNFKRTKIIIVLLFSILVLISLLLGIEDLVVRFQKDMSTFEFIDEPSNYNHWLYYFSFGISMLFSIKVIIKTKL